MCNRKTAVADVPTALPSDNWWSNSHSTLVSEHATVARRIRGIAALHVCVRVPEMRITAVHGLDDGESAMAAALRQLAALA
jgi:hypothetical protein